MQLRTVLTGLLVCSACAADRAPEHDDVSSAPLAQQVAAPTSEGVAAQPDDDEAARAVFDAREVKTYALSIAPEDLAKLDAQPAVPASLQVGSETRKVAVRYKGSVGAFMPPCTSGGFGRGPTTCTR